MPGVERNCKKCGYEIALPEGGQTCYAGKKWCDCNAVYTDSNYEGDKNND